MDGARSPQDRHFVFFELTLLAFTSPIARAAEQPQPGCCRPSKPMRNKVSNLWLVAGAVGAIGTFTSQAHSQFTNVSASAIPSLGLSTEAAKFGDFDLDGDLDIVYANGGDANNQQSKLLRNGTSSPGVGVGTYTNVTTTNFLKSVGTQVMSQSSRDVQLVDVDNDGDLDFYMSNHSTGTLQSNTWFINQGMLQGGTKGQFILDMSRWVGIAAAGSSIPNALKINSGDFSGGFVDWSCQCDFADVDKDGDWDLLHTAYGPNFDATVMTRLFFNSGTGFFSEYNPSGAVSGNPALATGSSAGWVEGTQLNDTADNSGTTHDITNMSLDADFSDLDGDFDNDIFANSRDTVSHFYQNRFIENGNGLGNGTTTRLYRDVSTQWGTNGLSSESGSNYDADLNDMDNDGDTDGYFLNYSGGLNDAWRTNNGTGAMSAGSTVPSSGADDNEIDWIDFDNDGDADPFISAFASNDKLYKNQFLETGSINLITQTIGTTVGNRSLGADVGDYDNDGDFDMIFAEDAGTNEILLQRNGAVVDTFAPRVTHIQQLANTTPTSSTRRVLARAYDNVNQEHFTHGSATFEFTVDGITHVVPAHYAGGNIFRTTFPGYWQGSISYNLKVKDRKGNEGTSPTKVFTVTPAGFSTFGSSVAGCLGAYNLGVYNCPTINNPEFAMTCTNGPAFTTQLCLVSDSQGTGLDELGVGIPIWADLFFATEVYALDAPADGSGLMGAFAAIPNDLGLIGKHFYSQFIVWDPGCGQVFSTSAGGHIVIQP